MSSSSPVEESGTVHPLANEQEKMLKLGCLARTTQSLGSCRVLLSHPPDIK